jgi:hypothetical protein
MMNPPAPNAQVPPPTPTITNFAENLRRLKIEPEETYTDSTACEEAGVRPVQGGRTFRSTWPRVA